MTRVYTTITEVMGIVGAVLVMVDALPAALTVECAPS